MLEETNSAFSVGLLAFAAGLPLLIWSPIAGILADRVKRQWIVAMALVLVAISCAGLALLTTLGRVLPWHIIVTSFLAGSAYALYSPARQALLPNLVPAGTVLNASTVDFSSTRLMSFFGPAIAGWLVDLVGVSTALMVQVVLFIPAILIFLQIGTALGSSTSGDNKGGSMLQGFREVTAYLRRDKPLMGLMLLGLVMVPVGMTYQKLMPVFVRDALRASASTLGLMVGISYLSHSAVGFALATIEDTFDRGRALLLSSVLFGGGLVVFAFSRQVLLALLLLFLLGIVAGVYLTLSNVLFQVRPPDPLRGRVVSAWGMVWGLLPFTSLAAGAFAERWGVTNAIVASGAVCVVFCIGMTSIGSQLRGL